MPLHEALIAVKDEKGDVSHIRFWIDPNGGTLDLCLSKVMAIATQLLDPTPLITGRIVDVALRAHADISGLTNNPAAPNVGSDVQEKLVLKPQTAYGTTQISIPTVDETALNPDGTFHFDTWENLLLDLTNESAVLALTSDLRGEHVLSVAGYTMESYSDWGKRRRR